MSQSTGNSGSAFPTRSTALPPPTPLRAISSLLTDKNSFTRRKWLSVPSALHGSGKGPAPLLRVWYSAAGPKGPEGGRGGLGQGSVTSIRDAGCGRVLRARLGSPRALGPRPRRAPRSPASRAPRRPAAALTLRRRCLPKPSRVWAARSQFRFSLWTPPSAAAARPPPAHVLAGSGITGAGRLPRESSRQAPRGGLGSHRRHLRLVTSRRLHPHLGFPCR